MFTKNWTIWILSMYVISILLFAPLFICIYNQIPNTYLSYRLIEIVISNGMFWLTLAVAVGMCVLPVYFFVRARKLLFPTLKDLVVQPGKINAERVKLECNQEAERMAYELIKRQQN